MKKWYARSGLWIGIGVVAVLAVAVGLIVGLPDTDEQRFRKILNNEAFFVDGRDHRTLKAYDYATGVRSDTERRYARVDFDGDGRDEWVLLSDSNWTPYLVLRMGDTCVYGEMFGTREMVDLKTDGTFLQSESGFQATYATLTFADGAYTVKELSLTDEEFFQKPSVEWITLNTKPEVFRAVTTAYKALDVTLKWDGTEIAALLVTDAKTGTLVQEIAVGENQRVAQELLYVADVNFDGEDDLVLPFNEAASGLSAKAYVWDAGAHQFVYAPIFETLTNPVVDSENKVIRSSRASDGIAAYSISTFDTAVRDFRVQNTLVYFYHNGMMHYEERAMRDGVMTTVAEWTLPLVNNDFYAMAPGLKTYYTQHDVWALGSHVWQTPLMLREGTPDVPMLYKQFLWDVENALDKNGNTLYWSDYAAGEPQDGEYHYTIMDINGDDIPELCVDTVSGLYLFSVNGGRIYHWYTGSSYERLLNNGAVLLERHGGAPDHVNYEYYTWNKYGEEETVITFSWWAADGETTPAYYEVNGEEVSKRAYRKATTSYLKIKSDKIEWEIGHFRQW